MTNYRSIACSLTNMSAKNHQNRLMCVEVSVQRQCRFLRHSVVAENVYKLTCILSGRKHAFLTFLFSERCF